VEIARARVDGAMPRRPTAAVPRTIHLIWLNGPPPAAVLHRASAWRLANPGWELRLWTEPDVPPDARPEVDERLRAPAERSDVLRLDVLRREGGVVVAPELRPRPLDRLVGHATCFAAASHGRPLTTLVGSTPGHAAIDAAIAEQRPREWSGYDPDATGGGALERALGAGAEIELLEALGVTVSADASTRNELLDEVLAVEAELVELYARLVELRGRDSG
jgi:hypothetical protein